MNFGTPEILLVLLAVVLLFGASRLPQLARSVGQSRKAFKEGMREAGEDEDDATSKPKQINANAEQPAISSLSDEEILAEMRRRNESKS
jgi:sec-independent protein translocase protein TatA